MDRPGSAHKKMPPKLKQEFRGELMSEDSEDYGLCETTQQFFCDACEFYELQPDEKRTLLLACIAYDRAEAARSCGCKAL